MGQSKLETYRSKRDFRRTCEPSGEEQGQGGHLFVVHKHDASSLHYDLRLQIGDVLKSWAIPKGPSVDPRERRLAVEVEEHPLEYYEFEGVIPEGEYGAGPTLVWDRGTWAPMGDIEKSLRSGTFKFRLAGEKLKGGWTLARLKPREREKRPSWLLIKEYDDAAETKTDILVERPQSVLSGLVIEELLPAKSRKKSHPILRPGALKGAQKGAMPDVLKPQLASPMDTPPEGDDWLHEIKFDGYRTIAIVENHKTRLLTRNGHDWTARYGAVADAFVALHCTRVIIDGEIVVLDERGVSRFGELQKALANGETWRLVFYAFDLLQLNNWGLSRVSLSQRRSLLKKLLGPAMDETSAIQFSDHVVGSGADFFDRACELNLEGVVSKRVDSSYRAGRSKTWVKTKAKRIGAFTIVGYTSSRAAGGLSALLLADKTKDGELCYAGKVGTGWSAAEAEALICRLEDLARSDPPLEFDKAQPRAEWVAPRLKATVHYTEITRDNHLRHPVYRGLREPKFSGHRSRSTKRYITDEHLASIWVTNPERKMFSMRGPTKLDLAIYYAKIGDFMLSHIMNRPISLVRCPTGKVEDCFFQRHAFTGMPAEVGIFQHKKNGSDREYLFVDDARGFLALAQFGVVEFHPWGCRIDKPERPDRMYFDLDPGEGVDWRDVVAAAGVLRSAIERYGLTAFVKTSGKKGLHIVVPMKRLYSWKCLHETSGSIAAALSKEFPATFTATMSKQKRKNRIFIDFHRNARSATTVAPYSLRASQELPVSVPLTWDNMQLLDGPRDLDYANVFDLLYKSGDPWADIDASAGAFSKALLGK